MYTSDFSLRIAAPEDAAALLGIYAPYVEQTAVSFEYQVPSVDEFADRIRNTLKKYPYLTAWKDNRILGYCYVSPFHGRQAYDWSVETSIYVDQQAKRSGIGKFLHDALEQILLTQGILNLNACIAFPIGEDPYLTQDSVRFHEKMGYRHAAHFHQCGYKFQRWYDVVWMEKTLGPHLEQQPPVIPFPELSSRSSY